MPKNVSKNIVDKIFYEKEPGKNTILTIELLTFIWKKIRYENGL